MSVKQAGFFHCFLSYARLDADANPHFETFFEQLVGALSSVIGGSREQACFRDQKSIAIGSRWTETLVGALQTCRVFIPMYSRNFFQSEYCGKEWEYFQRRRQALDSADGTCPLAIMPIFWTRPSGWEDVQPEVVKSVQHYSGNFGEAYRNLGVESLLRRGSDKELGLFIDEYVNAVGEVIHRPLPSRTPPPMNLKEIHSAFTPPPKPGSSRVEKPPSTEPPRSELRLHFNHLLHSHVALFAGRQEETRQVLRHVQELKTGYVFIEGLSGYGKTSFLAKLVRDYPDFAYHFISQTYRGIGREFDPTDQDSLIDNICEQLGADRPKLRAIRDPRVRFQALLDRDPSDRPMVIVIDAIDEVGAHPNFLFGLLPPVLPQGVTIIVSARTQGDRNYLSEVGLNLNQLSLHLQLRGFRREEVEQLLMLAGGAAGRLSENDAFVDRLCEVSDGDPFYLRFLVEDIRSRVITQQNVDDVPTGLYDYLDRQLAQLDNSAVLAQQRDIIGLILFADGPLSRSDLIAMVEGLEGLNFDNVIRDIHRFLMVSDNKYTLCHGRFKEYFASKIQ